MASASEVALHIPADTGRKVRLGALAHEAIRHNLRRRDNDFYHFTPANLQELSQGLKQPWIGGYVFLDAPNGRTGMICLERASQGYKWSFRPEGALLRFQGEEHKGRCYQENFTA